MIIQFYGGYVPLLKLRDLLHTTKEGVSAYNIIETAKSLGLDSAGYKVDNLNNIKLPCIAFVTINSFDHYVVIYKIDNKLLIADPASKIKKMSFEEFNKIFNNIVIVFSKRKELIKYKVNSYPKFIINVLKKYKIDFIKIVFISIFVTILSILTSFYTEIMINHLVKSLLFKIFLLFLFINIFKNIFEYIRNRLLIKMQSIMNRDLTNEIYKKIVLLPYRYFKNRTTGEVITRFNDLNIINETIIKIIITIILDLLLMLSSGIVLLLINSKLFLLSFIIMFLYFLVAVLFSKVLEKRLIIIKEKRSLLNSNIIESINGYETIKGLGIEEGIIKKYEIMNNSMINDNYKYEKIYNLEIFLKNIINEIGLCFLILIGTLLVINNNMNIGNLITFVSLFTYFISPINNIINLDKDIKNSKISYNRIDELLIETSSNDIVHKLPFNNIKLNNLSYSYDNLENVLSNINISINSNEKIMIEGKSGSGKSTILKLVKKYYEIDRGMLFIDNIDINDISTNEIDKNITYVSLNEILFTDTLYNNLKLNRSISDQDIESIADECYIDFVDKNIGLNVMIEENGFNLSSGEKQRIILARSLLNNFKILILDEIFSNMDIDLERKILKNLFSKYKNKTIIVVSHRNNNADLFDRIITISDGKIKNDVKRCL